MTRDAAIFKVARKMLARTTQAALAKRMERSEVTVRRIERGDQRVTVEDRALAAQMVGLGFDWETESYTTPPEFPHGAVERLLKRRGESKPRTITLDADTYDGLQLIASEKKMADIPTYLKDHVQQYRLRVGGDLSALASHADDKQEAHPEAQKRARSHAPKRQRS